MNEVTESKQESPMEIAVRLGRTLGRREAFAALAGRCSAAEVECLRRMREGKEYKEVASSWAEFCLKHLKVNRRSVDRQIAYLEEFGPAYFHLTQIAHINATEYRAIASHVSKEGVRAGNEIIALVPENSRKLENVLTQLLIEAAQEKPAAPPTPLQSILSRIKHVAEALAGLPGPLPRQHMLELEQAICEIQKEGTRLGVC